MNNLPKLLDFYFGYRASFILCGGRLMKQCYLWSIGTQNHLQREKLVTLSISRCGKDSKYDSLLINNSQEAVLVLCLI